jgi:hypothetical protein
MSCLRCGRSELASARAQAFPDKPIPWGWVWTINPGTLGDAAICERCTVTHASPRTDNPRPLWDEVRRRIDEHAERGTIPRLDDRDRDSATKLTVAYPAEKLAVMFVAEQRFAAELARQIGALEKNPRPETAVPVIDQVREIIHDKVAALTRSFSPDDPWIQAMLSVLEAIDEKWPTPTGGEVARR